MQACHCVFVIFSVWFWIVGKGCLFARIISLNNLLPSALVQHAWKIISTIRLVNLIVISCNIGMNKTFFERDLVNICVTKVYASVSILWFNFSFALLKCFHVHDHCVWKYIICKDQIMTTFNANALMCLSKNHIKNIFIINTAKIKLKHVDETDI